MGGTGVIDNFLGTFTQYIDSGFGLVQGDVRWLAGVLICQICGALEPGQTSQWLLAEPQLE
jgi:type IV secretory pathway TrbL component